MQTPPVWLKWTLPALVLATLCFFSTFVYSPLTITPHDVLSALHHALSGQEYGSIAERLVAESRLPRIAVGVMCGAVLAVSGLLLQTMTRNPLASPSLLSINAGAALGVIVLTAFSPAVLHGATLSAAAAVGGGLSWSVVMWISMRGGRLQQSRLILSGIAVSAFCLALGKAALIIAEDQAVGVLRWLAGGLSNMDAAKLSVYFPFVLLPVLPLIWLTPKLNMLRLSDDAAQSLGLSVRHLRLVIHLIVLVWVGATVAVTGPIAFIGLIVPHICRLWAGYDLRVAVPLCALLGAIFLIAADVLAMALAYPAQLQAGVVIALIGAPCFVFLAKRRREA